MSKITYLIKKFSAASMSAIIDANYVIQEYAAQGYDLTLRQVYYKFVARDLFPDSRRWSWTGKSWVRDPNGTKNAEPNYKWLGGLLNDARLAGLIDWDYIVDRTRNLHSLANWRGAKERLEGAAATFRIDKWARQPHRVEVWIEKDALAGIFIRVCDELQVPFFSCRGYTSQSEMWGASQRLLSYREAGQQPIILHFGDHDPSGMDMTRDIKDRLHLFMGGGMKLTRLALNMNQILEYEPPPNPAKMGDSRAPEYVDLYGDESWELDALEPTVLVDLVERNVARYRDQKIWDEDLVTEEAHRQVLVKAAQKAKNAL